MVNAHFLQTRDHNEIPADRKELLNGEPYNFCKPVTITKLQLTERNCSDEVHLYHLSLQSLL